MKKYLILLLVFSSITNLSLFAQDINQNTTPDYEKGVLDGKNAASTENRLMWGLLGCGSTCFFGALGCLGSTLVGYLMEPSTPYVSTTKGEDYVRGFKEGYSSSVKTKRATSAFIGGCISGVLQTAIYIPVYILYGAAIMAQFSTIFK